MTIDRCNKKWRESGQFASRAASVIYLNIKSDPYLLIIENIIPLIRKLLPI